MKMEKRYKHHQTQLGKVRVQKFCNKNDKTLQQMNSMKSRRGRG
jgi:hypothetical protein